LIKYLSSIGTKKQQIVTSSQSSNKHDFTYC